MICTSNIFNQCKKFIEFLSGRFEKSEAQDSSDKDENYYARVGRRVLLIGFGGFLLWALFAPLDKGVPAEGYVITDGNRKSVQHLSGGIVDQILVKEGESVQQGQVLVKMNSIQASSQFYATKESIAGSEGQLLGLKNSVANEKIQIALIDEQLKGLRELAKDGYIPRNKVLELERIQAQIRSTLATDQGNLERVQRQVSELQEKLKAYEFDLDNTFVKSPATGKVVNLAFFTPGGVISPGFKLMDVVPDNQPLIAEAQVPVNLIDKVHVGQLVDMNFTALNQRTTPKIPATLIVVSADRVVDEKSGASFYKIQAQVTPKGESLLKDNQIRPGMPVQIFVVTGERSLMSYLLKPLLDRARSALTEE